MLEAGTYRAHPMGALLGMSSTGKEQVGVELKLLDHPGVTIGWIGFFTDAALEWTVKALRTCGWKGDDLTDLSTVGDVEEVNIVVEHEEYEGKTYPRVKYINSTGGLAMKTQLTAVEAKTFAARMKGQIVALGGGASARPQAKPKPAAPRPASPPPAGERQPGAVADDDVPW